jgi:hypothetical protein
MIKLHWIHLPGGESYAIAAGFRVSVQATAKGYRAGIDNVKLHASYYETREMAQQAAEYVLEEWCFQALRELGNSTLYD